MEKFEVISHTADVGIKIFGKTEKEFLENAAYGMFSLLADLGEIKQNKKIRVKTEGVDIETLLIGWLNELLYQSNYRKMLFSSFKIKEITTQINKKTTPKKNIKLKAEVFGQQVDFSQNPLPMEIKAATYHKLKVQKDKTGFSGTVIFDV